VKGGKEATVYCCQADPATGYDLLAAKIYRHRQSRSMKNYASYHEGRHITADKRSLRAIKNKS
jgi:RIO kinase 1